MGHSTHRHKTKTKKPSRPSLPAPTESLIGTSATDTELSRRTDKSSYSIPEDGDPVTIPIHFPKDNNNRGQDPYFSNNLPQSQQQSSHTSLLIEYFEGGKHRSSRSASRSLPTRPSVRVRVTPSGARKSKDKDDAVHISESGNRIYSRRISFGSPTPNNRQIAADSSVTDLPRDFPGPPSSSVSLEDLRGNLASSPSPPPFMPIDKGSDLTDLKYSNPVSEISSMPADSMLDDPSLVSRRKRSQSFDRNNETPKDFLKTPTRRRSRSLSKERIAHRVAEKLSNEQRDVAASPGKQRRAERSRGGSKDIYAAENLKSSPKYSQSRQRDVDMDSAKSSLLSASGEQYSVHSSKSSINNPRLLETVEDAIRRLILPELKDLKKDQRVLSNSSKFDRELPPPSASSNTKDRRLSKHSSAPDVIKPSFVLKRSSKDEGSAVLSDGSQRTEKGRRGSASRELESASGRSRRSSRSSLTTEDNRSERRRSKGHRGAEIAAAGAGGTALTAAALSHHNSLSSMDSKQSGRTKGSRDVRSQAESVIHEPSVPDVGGGKTELAFQRYNVPQMPMHSEVDSGLTRDSLLSERSAETSSLTPDKYPKSGNVSRGLAIQSSDPTSQTQTQTQHRSPLGVYFSNASRQSPSHHSASDNDLRESIHSPMSGSTLSSDEGNAAYADLADPYEYAGFHEQQEGERSGIMPHQPRALSPIESVGSGEGSEKTWTEDQGKGVQQGASRDMPLEKGVGPGQESNLSSIDTMSSAPSTAIAQATRSGPAAAVENRFSRGEFGSGLDYEESHISQNTAESPAYPRYYPQQQHSRQDSWNNGRDMGSIVDGSEVSYLQNVNKGHHVTQGTGANPQLINPVGVESAVASVLEPSAVTSRSSKVTVANRSQPDFNAEPPPPLPANYVGQPASGGASRELQSGPYPMAESATREMQGTPQRSVRSTPISGKGTPRGTPRETLASPDRPAEIGGGSRDLGLEAENQPTGNGFHGSPKLFEQYESKEPRRSPHPWKAAPFAAGAAYAAGRMSKEPQVTPSPAQGASRDLAGTPQESKRWQQRGSTGSSGAVSFPKRMGMSSPPQSVAESIEDQEAPAVAEKSQEEQTSDVSRSPEADEHNSPESEESEINTNPSIIQGPIGQYDDRQSPAKGGEKELPYPEDNEVTREKQPDYDFGGFGYDQNKAKRATYDSNGFFNHPQDDYMDEEPMFETPSGAKDEGYVSGANLASPTPGSGSRDISDGSIGMGIYDNPPAGGHARNLSGYSNGVGSPIYDSATGRGIERIKSKDVIALMDHVRISFFFFFFFSFGSYS